MADRAPAGSVTEKLFAVVKGRFPNAVLISGYRPGAITVSGKRSMHAEASAVDLPPSREIFDWIRDNWSGITFELIYSPAGDKQIYKGQPHVYTGAVKATHYNHVHWSVKKENIAALGSPSGSPSGSGGNTVLADLPTSPVSAVTGFDDVLDFFQNRNGARRLALVGVGVGLVFIGLPVMFRSKIGNAVKEVMG